MSKDLLKKVEGGELSPEGLEIAAHVGHAAARQALGMAGPASEEWLRHGRRSCLSPRQ